jgi:hypothetical protein
VHLIMYLTPGVLNASDFACSAPGSGFFPLHLPEVGHCSRLLAVCSVSRFGSLLANPQDLYLPSFILRYSVSVWFPHQEIAQSPEKKLVEYLLPSSTQRLNTVTMDDILEGDACAGTRELHARKLHTCKPSRAMLNSQFVQEAGAVTAFNVNFHSSCILSAHLISLLQANNSTDPTHARAISSRRSTRVATQPKLDYIYIRASAIPPNKQLRIRLLPSER